MGMYVECLVVPIDISDVIHLKTLIYRWEIVFFKSGTLSQFNAPFCYARFIVSVFSEEQFSII